MKPSDIIAIVTGTIAGSNQNIPGMDSPMLQGALAAFLVYLGKAALVWASKPARDLSRENAQQILCDTCPHRLPPGTCKHGPTPTENEHTRTRRKYYLRPQVPPPLGTTKAPGQTPHPKPAGKQYTAGGDDCEDGK